jgi:formylmethanofuran dehydrogenase subunit B
MSIQSPVPCGCEVIPLPNNEEKRAMKVVSHAVCTFCGCTCDDIELHVEGNRIVKAKHACSLGESWFTCHSAEPCYPAALIEGEPATLDAAIDATADVLLRANYPLIYGLSNMTCEAQRAAVTLAEDLGGAIDSHSSL